MQAKFEYLQLIRHQPRPRLPKPTTTFKKTQLPTGSDELKELREKAGLLGAVAAAGVKKGFGALVSAAKKAAAPTSPRGGGGWGGALPRAL